MTTPPEAIFKAVNRKTGEIVWITDLYWFEENGVHDMTGEGSYDSWELTFVAG
jgi:hypothetical protein